MISITMISSRLTFLLLLFLVNSAFLYADNNYEELKKEIDGVTNDFVYNKFSKNEATGDVVVFRWNDSLKDLEVLMVKRSSYPNKDAWATPGGMKDHERDQDFLARELYEEADVITSHEMLELSTKSDIALYDLRSAPTHKKVLAKTVLVNPNVTPKAGSDAREVEFKPLSRIYDGDIEIAFNHAIWIKEAVEKMSESEDVIGTDDEINKKFAAYNNHDFKAKIDEIIELNTARNTKLAGFINIKRFLDRQPLIKDQNGNELWPTLEGVKGYVNDESYTSTTLNLLKHNNDTDKKKNSLETTQYCLITAAGVLTLAMVFNQFILPAFGY